MAELCLALLSLRIHDITFTSSVFRFHGKFCDSLWVTGFQLHTLLLPPSPYPTHRDDGHGDGRQTDPPPALPSSPSCYLCGAGWEVRRRSAVSARAPKARCFRSEGYTQSRNCPTVRQNYTCHTMPKQSFLLPHCTPPPRGNRVRACAPCRLPVRPFSPRRVAPTHPRPHASTSSVDVCHAVDIPVRVRVVWGTVWGGTLWATTFRSVGLWFCRHARQWARWASPRRLPCRSAAMCALLENHRAQRTTQGRSLRSVLLSTIDGGNGNVE